ncbi:MAG TPA: hypothetical protein VK158_00205 [Acidobacteriota bacterium]|nr:hypothetical protein [Acidobacteriota bacterium]
MDEMPVYVRIDEYKEVLDLIGQLKSKLADAKNTIDQIHQLKAEEDAELESWKVGLADVEAKIAHLDQSLFQPHK